MQIHPWFLFLMEYQLSLHFFKNPEAILVEEMIFRD